MLLFGAGVAPGQSQQRRDLIEEALDQVVERIDIADTPVREVLAILEEKTGLPFALDEAVLELLPYGGRTRISIEIRGMTVRESLAQVLESLGLRMVVESDRVRVVPHDWLARLGRRATAEEMTLVASLSEEPGDKLIVSDGLPLEFRIDPSGSPRERFAAAVRQQPACRALRRLEAACDSLRWTWRPDGDRVVITTLRDDVSRRLDRPIDLAYQQVPLDEALVDFGKRVGVTVLFKPGALRDIAARDRNIDLVQRGVTLRQTLERVCGSTGLNYEVQEEGVLLGCSGRREGAASASSPRYVRMQVEIRPGVTVDVLVPESQIPDDLRDDFQQRLQEALRRP